MLCVFIALAADQGPSTNSFFSSIDAMTKSTEPLWTPVPSSSAASHMQQFISECAQRYDREFPDYASLHKWSVNHPGDFWESVARYSGIRYSHRPSKVLQQPGGIQTARWFNDGKLNFAENLLQGDPDGVALVFRDERGRRSQLTRAELKLQVARLANAMLREGLQKGDRVAAMLPNCPEAVVVMLGAASIGAVFSSCSPDFGQQAVLERFGQIEPRLLFVCDGYSYAGKNIDCRSKASAVAGALTDLAAFVVVPFLDDKPDISVQEGSVLFDEFLSEDSAIIYEQLPFNSPLYILYSSGTTGKPKCIVHGAGGTLLQHKKELLLHTDLQQDDVIFYFTTCGWMMWNWLVSALSTGATVVLYEGSPAYPEPDSLLQMGAEERVNVFGTSPRYLSALEKTVGSDVTGWPELRTVLSTGAPLASESFDFIKNTLGSQVQLSSISGGTDLISCFALGNPLLPVYRGELQCPGLGMAVEIFDAEANCLQGQSGELVCTQPFPSMPLGFWHDKDGRYEAAYFEKFPGVWAHGDIAEFTANGGLKIHGRSDAVLNPGGVRIGTSEVCGPAMAVDEVMEAIAIALQEKGEEHIILFVILRNNLQLDDALRDKIRFFIRNQASPRHEPARIIQVADIPRTLSGKPVELAVKAIVQGQPVENLSVIANPESLGHFRGRL
ncbi:MAG: acetoacetate--CoA ligase [Gammaproteobacteria bacterium]